jgi:hypothetical protein
MLPAEPSAYDYLSTYVRIMEKSSTPAVARATILAILVLVLCFLFVIGICSFLSAAVASIIS